MSGAVAVVTDSSSQLPHRIAVTHDIAVVPVSIAIDEAAVDEADVDLDSFWHALESGANITTSTPSPGRFAAEYDKLRTAGAECILSLHVDSRVSAVADAARLGAEESAADVTVVDTGQTSFGVALCVLEAVAALARGDTADEAVARALARAEGIENVFVVGAGSSGRLGVAEGTVLSFAGGSAKPLATANGAGAAIAAMVGRVAEQEGSLGVAVGHAHPDLARCADRLAEELGRLPGVVEGLRYRVGPSVAAHTGPWSFGAFFWRMDD